MSCVSSCSTRSSANLATGLGLGGDGALVVVSKWGQILVLLGAIALCGLRGARPGADRAAWVVLTAALVAWTAGNLYLLGHEGSGLVGLRDRVSTLGGQLQIESPPGGGTRIVATLPVPGR